MNKKYNYFYKITNLINNRYYFGVHKTNNIDDGYMGSGTRLKESIIEYGIENFSKEILNYFDNFHDALKYEAKVVTEDLVNDIECYNLKKGGIGGWDNKNTIAVKDNDNNFFRVDINDERYINGELKFIWKDRKHNDITVNKMKLSHQLNEDQKGEKNSQYETYWIMKDNENKKIKKEDLYFWLQQGWVKGRNIKYDYSPNKSLYGDKNSGFGKIYIYNNILKENKRIKKEELNYWLEQNWIKGRKIKFK
jgi:hypothetical protein